jgi:MFS family permease
VKKPLYHLTDSSKIPDIVSSVKEPPNTFRALLFLAGTGSYLLWAAGAAIPLLRLDFGISRTLASTHNISTGVGSVLGARFAVTLLKIFGRQILSRAMIIVMFLGILAMIVGNTIWITVPAIGFAAYAQTTINALSLAQISHDDQPSLRRMLLQTGIQAGVGGVAIFLISASLHANLGWRLPIFAGLFLLSPLALFIVWRVKFLDSSASQVQLTHHMKSSKLKSQVFLLGLLMSFVEMGVSFWAIDLLISRGAGVALGALGSALLAIGIFATRIGIAFSHMEPRQVMVLAVTLLLTGISTICLVHSAGATMIGLVIAGCGTAPLFAASVFQISEGYPDAELRISRYMMGTSIAIGLAPFILAIVFDNAGFIAGYAILIPVVGAAYLLWRSLGRHRTFDYQVCTLKTSPNC